MPRHREEDDRRDVGRIRRDGRWMPDIEVEDQLASDIHPGIPRGWTLDGRRAYLRERSGARGFDDRVVTRPRDYVPFQSIFEPDGRHAYHPEEDAEHPRFANQWTQMDVVDRDFTRDERLEVYRQNRVDPNIFPPDHVFDLGEPRSSPALFGPGGPHGPVPTGGRFPRVDPEDDFDDDEVIVRGGRSDDPIEIMEDELDMRRGGRRQDPREIMEDELDMRRGGRRDDPFDDLEDADDVLDMLNETWVRGGNTPMGGRPRGRDRGFVDDEDDFEDDPMAGDYDEWEGYQNWGR